MPRVALSAQEATVRNRPARKPVASSILSTRRPAGRCEQALSLRLFPIRALNALPNVRPVLVPAFLRGGTDRRLRARHCAAGDRARPCDAADLRPCRAQRSLGGARGRTRHRGARDARGGARDRAHDAPGGGARHHATARHLSAPGRAPRRRGRADRARGVWSRCRPPAQRPEDRGRRHDRRVPPRPRDRRARHAAEPVAGLGQSRGLRAGHPDARARGARRAPGRGLGGVRADRRAGDPAGAGARGALCLAPRFPGAPPRHGDAPPRRGRPRPPRSRSAGRARSPSSAPASSGCASGW